MPFGIDIWEQLCFPDVSYCRATLRGSPTALLKLLIRWATGFTSSSLASCCLCILQVPVVDRMPCNFSLFHWNDTGGGNYTIRSGLQHERPLCHEDQTGILNLVSSPVEELLGFGQFEAVSFVSCPFVPAFVCIFQTKLKV